jgi:hypothetical protein
MKATTLLLSQHRRVEQLLDAVERERYVRRSLLENLADDVSATLAMKEMILYPALASALDRPPQGGENDAIRRALQGCFEAADDDVAFACALADLDDAIAARFLVEERDLFPRVEATVAADDLERLGAKMRRLYREIVEADGDARASSIGRPCRADWYGFAGPLPTAS